MPKKLIQKSDGVGPRMESVNAIFVIHRMYLSDVFPTLSFVNFLRRFGQESKCFLQIAFFVCFCLFEFALNRSS